MRIRTSLVILFALPLAMNGEKPYTFANTPGKLPKQVVPLEYSIRIVPDPDKLTFWGSESVKLKVSAPVHELVLNSVELNITKASMDGTQ
jgi:puromycin-sensitive aminopeptidase